MTGSLVLPMAIAVSLLATTAAHAEQSGQRAIVGSGTASVKQTPSLLRMRVQLQEKAATAEEALQKLADRQQAARLQLESMGASDESIKISDATFPAEDSATEQQMQQLAMYQMQANGRVPAGLEPIKSVTVVSTVTAEWPLKQESNEQLLVFASELKNKVEEADLSGLKEPKQLTPEEEELQAEMQEMMGSIYTGESVSSGEPAFYYVARVSENARMQAMAEAFAKAEGEAKMLAAAAGVQLGALQALTANPSSSSGVYDYYSEYMRYMASASGTTGDEEASDNEVFAATPDALVLRARVQASFAIE